MPDRIVRPGILTSEAVNQISWAAEVFYRRLMSVVDDFGRYDGRPSILRAQLYPLKLNNVCEPDVAKWILETEKAALVRVYAVDTRPYVEIQKFNQRLRAKKSKWPAPGDCGHLHAIDSRCTPPSDSVSVSESVSSDPGLEGAGRKGFPVTPDDAIAQCGLQMNTRDWILHCYDKAASRGGRDAKDIEIRDFPAFVRTEWKYEQNRRGREQFGGDPNGNLTPMDKKIRSDEHVLVSKHLADLRASYDGHSTWKPADLDKRRRLEARQRELEKMLGMQLG